MKIPLCGLALALLVAGCTTRTVEGDGHLIDAERAVQPFTKIALGGNLRAEVAPGEPRISLHLDENLAPKVHAIVSRERLSVAPARGVALVPSPGSVVHIAAPRLDALETSGTSSLLGKTNAKSVTLSASGASKLTAETLTASAVSVSASGSSEVEVSGAGAKLVVEASGSAKVGSALPSEEVSVTASGSARVTVHASRKVQLQASGSSAITVVGNPSVREVQSSGAVKITFSP